VTKHNRSTPRVNRQMFAELDALIDEYWEVLAESELADKSIQDYFYFAWAFSRWLKGEFTPGERLRPPGLT